MVAQLLRQGLQDADAGVPWRARLSRAASARIAIIHGAPDTESTFEAGRLPGRGTLGSQAAKHGAVVRAVPGLDRRVAAKARELMSVEFRNVHAGPLAGFSATAPAGSI